MIQLINFRSKFETGQEKIDDYLTIGGICGIGGKKYGAGAPGGGLSSDAIGIPGTICCGIIIGI